MKISGVGPGGAPSSKRTDKSKRGSGDFAQHLRSDGAEAEDTQGVGSPSALTAIDSLLAAQAVDPDAGRGRGRERLMRRGEDILDRLEEIRRGLLLGAVPKAQLAELAGIVRARREAGADPHLAAILDEIELRAEVELAKLSRR